MYMTGEAVALGIGQKPRSPYCLTCTDQAGASDIEVRFDDMERSAEGLSFDYEQVNSPMDDECQLCGATFPMGEDHTDHLDADR